MKKIFLMFCIVLVCAAAFAQNGVIRELSGTVELKNSGSSSYVPAKAGDKLSLDTVISTGFKSTALVSLGSALITVRPLTRLTLTEIQASSGTETINVNLQAGRVRVDVSPPAGTRTTMSVSSPMATASVRGTSLDFDTRNLKVNHGQVNFKGKKGHARLVNGGSSSKVTEDGKAVDPVQMKNRELAPPPPAGTDITGGSGAEGPGSSSGVIKIWPDYGIDAIEEG